MNCELALSVTPKETTFNWCLVYSILIWSSGTTALVGISGFVTNGIAINIAKIIGITPTNNIAALTMIFLVRYQIN